MCIRDSPRIVQNYAGGDIPLAPGVTIEAAMFPALAKCVGQDLIVTDGTTLLGADDKAGIAEILTMAEFLLAHPEIRRGKICIAFTPDEEVGCGTDAFDLQAFGADFAYTVDGGEVGEIEYEKMCIRDSLGELGDTAENLLHAAEGENAEWTDMYARMAREADEEGFHDLAEQFRGVAAIEKEQDVYKRQAFPSLTGRL